MSRCPGGIEAGDAAVSPARIGTYATSPPGTIVSLPSDRNSQIGDTAAVTMNATGGVFNGTEFGATTNARTITDTFGSLTVLRRACTINCVRWSRR